VLVKRRKNGVLEKDDVGRKNARDRRRAANGVQKAFPTKAVGWE
jgi:hypothetical protein